MKEHPLVMYRDPYEISKDIYRLEEERDHWRQAYCKAEQETARMEAWATKLHKEVQELRKLQPKE